MKSGTSAFLAAAGALAFIAGVGSAPVALADSGDAWTRLTTDKGCWLVKYSIVYGGMETSPERPGFVWSGPCISGQPINGEGMFYEQYDGQVRTWKGRVVNGYPEGHWTQKVYALGQDKRWTVVNELEDNFTHGCNGWGCESGPRDMMIVQPITPARYSLVSDGAWAWNGFGVPAPQQSATAATRPPVPAASPSAGAARPSPNARAVPVSSATSDIRGGDCVKIVPGPKGQFWNVVNGCAVPVIGSYCYENDGFDSCAKHKSSGFGPIRPGKKEGISSGGDGRVEWRIAWCDYDKWNKGTCKLKHPWEIE